MLLSIIGAMSTFDIILATTDGRFNTRTMAYDVYKETFRGSLEMGLPSALSVVQFLIILLFVVVAVRQTRKRGGVLMRNSKTTQILSYAVVGLSLILYVVPSAACIQCIAQILQRVSAQPDRDRSEHGMEQLYASMV